MLPSLSSSANSSCPQGLIPEDLDSTNSHAPDLRKKILEASNLCNIFAQATLLLDDESTGNGIFSAIKNVSVPSDYLNILDEELLKAIHESIKILNTHEGEFLRIGKKVDRALEKLRRSALKCIEATRSPTSRAVISAVRELLLQSVECWRTCLTTPVGSLMPISHPTYDCIRVHLASEGFNSEGCINTSTRYIIHSLSN